MQVDVIMPKMGESIQEGTVIRWLKKEGERIKKDETILEISTDKVDSDIPSPASGVLEKILVNERETVPVGRVIALIKTDVGDQERVSAVKSNLPERPAEKILFQTNSTGSIAKSQNGRGRFYSPLVRTIAKKEGIDKNQLEAIPGSGEGGRVTKSDIMNYIVGRRENGSGPTAENFLGDSKKIELPGLEKKYPSPGFRIVQMDSIQRVMAEHTMRSVTNSPQVTIVDEINMTSIVNYRLRIFKEFEKTAGFKLTYTHFFAYAAIAALKEFPIINSSIEGDAIIYKNFINLGVAVATPKGLLVPVIHHAEGMDFNRLAHAISELTVRTREKKLSPEDTANGTFSITNYGVFGSIIGTPIFTLPQVAILGAGAIKKRPVVSDDESDHPSISIRSMVYLTLTFDHRIIDGATGGQFLSKIKWYLENFDFEKVRNGL